MKPAARWWKGLRCLRGRIGKTGVAVAACAAVAGPAYADPQFSALVYGFAESDTFTQALAGFLENSWDPSKRGLSDALLQETTSAAFTILAGPINAVTYSNAFNLQVAVNNAGAAQPAPSVAIYVSASASTAFLAPNLLSNPTVAQIGDNLFVVPLLGANDDLVTMTYASVQAAANVALCPPSAPPAQVEDSVATSSPGFSQEPKFFINIIAIGFEDWYAINDGPLQPLSAAGFTMTDFINPMVYASIPAFASLTETPTGNVFAAAGAQDFTVPDPLTVGDTITFYSTINAETLAVCADCPEPAPIALLGAGFLVTCFVPGYHRRTRRSVDRRE